ncbi:MAG TPA: DUF2087 domain-containing protein [Vicinamibacterales bacterium]
MAGARPDAHKAQRRAILAFLSEHRRTLAEVASALGCRQDQAHKHLRRLVDAGLVEELVTAHHPVAYCLAPGADVADLDRAHEPKARRTAESEAAHVLANYLVDGRLKAIPASAKRKLPILVWLLEQFEPARRYPEREVNALLKRYHEDYALLRRALIDLRFMFRADGYYWRNPDAQVIEKAMHDAGF